MLFNLSQDSGVKRAELWATLGAAGRAAVVTAATSTAEPAVAKIALGLLFNLSLDSGVISAELWASLGAAGRAAVVTAATNSAKPAIAKLALGLLINLTLDSDGRRSELWATLGAAGRAAVVNTATSSAEQALARQAMRLLASLSNYSDDRTTKSWSFLGALGRATDDRTTKIWSTLGAAGRTAVVTAATNPSQPDVAESALFLLSHLTARTQSRAIELWGTLGAQDREGLINAATTVGEPKIVLRALELMNFWQEIPEIKAEIWPLLQPRLAQLWAVSQLPNVEQKASRFLFNQIQGNIYRARQALNALIVAPPTISMHNTIAALRLWGREVSHDLPERLALLTGIVQANTTAQKMAVFTTAVMSGIDIRNHPRDVREALRNQLLAIPMAEGIDPEPYRQRMRLGLDAACGNTYTVLESPVLSVPEKLQLLETLYSSRGFLSAQLAQQELSKIRLMPNTSRDFKLQVIGLILNHGQASSTQFKEILTWLKGEFETDTHTVFTNPETLGDITDEQIYALAEQRQQYLSLYQNFGTHMTHDFIQEEIAQINLRVTAEEIPRDFGETLIFQLRQFLSTVGTNTGVKDDRQFDSKNESK
ncbi:hypothetical protein [Polaromonas vacuolata]|uniref:hypothetical protein n=1 Tax=Polaromonas vacuolata TaxID=37448 RepID=UPI0014567BBB|nr:hypothetical protein [Polaromonas vacuolata]